MEVTSTSIGFAGSSSEVSTPAAHEEDNRHGHFAALAVPLALKATASIPLIASSSHQSEGLGRDGKSSGLRFQEDRHELDVPSPRLQPCLSVRDKSQDMSATGRENKEPLCLLDLPVDILKDIVKEVTHTNDLTSLALCHSALHRLATPHIYSRFDIVWPDSTTNTEARSGVDALTYGLATLVMAEEIFEEAPIQRQDRSNRYSTTGLGKATETTIRRRRGNHYAQFTKKFSLGNGPADWVQEYLITKEGGKMLGTLVALAVARMRSLETFVWDMPTGVIRDIWLALSSLGDRGDARPCKLEKVWIRWHDNSSTETPTRIPSHIGLPTMPPPLGQNYDASAPVPQLHSGALDRVEHPSLSVLPPLKSLSVLDIDELAYLDEMAVLIRNSLDKLRELRIGIARHAITKDWVTVWIGENVQQVDPDYPTAGSATIGEKRLGGVLGVLTGLVCDMRRPRVALPERTRHERPTSSDQAHGPVAELALIQDADQINVAMVEGSDFTSLQDVMPELPRYEQDPSFASPPSSPIDADDQFRGVPPAGSDPAITDALSVITAQDKFAPSSHGEDIQVPEPLEIVTALQQVVDNVLQLESLELERVPIAVPLLQQALDWTRLTSLTLLHCPNHEQFWKTLRRAFVPRPKSPMYPQPHRTPTSTPRKHRRASVTNDMDYEYPLKLKKIHTNNVSPALITFLKETLAPNSLETLFLQEARSYSSTVQVDAIFRGPLRRHRGSLKRLLIDSSEKGSDGLPTSSSRWRRWMLTREILGFVCSGKMPALRELGMAIDYRDWHFFLQQLPSIPHLRSLYLPFLADHVHGVNVDPQELALQLVDIVALRPEVELCYMGIANKCFEILENRKDSDPRNESVLGVLPSGPTDPDVPASDDGDEDEDADEDVDGEEAEDDEEENEEDDTESEDEENDDDTDSEGDVSEVDTKTAARLRLREILFYDDKVAIFKARHGRL